MPNKSTSTGRYSPNTVIEDDKTGTEKETTEIKTDTKNDTGEVETDNTSNNVSTGPSLTTRATDAMSRLLQSINIFADPNPPKVEKEKSQKPLSEDFINQMKASNAFKDKSDTMRIALRTKGHQFNKHVAYRVENMFSNIDAGIAKLAGFLYDVATSPVWITYQAPQYVSKTLASVYRSIQSKRQAKAEKSQNLKLASKRDFATQVGAFADVSDNSKAFDTQDVDVTEPIEGLAVSPEPVFEKQWTSLEIEKKNRGPFKKTNISEDSDVNKFVSAGRVVKTPMVGPLNKDDVTRPDIFSIDQAKKSGFDKKAAITATDLKSMAKKITKAKTVGLSDMLAKEKNIWMSVTGENAKLRQEIKDKAEERSEEIKQNEAMAEFLNDFYSIDANVEKDQAFKAKHPRIAKIKEKTGHIVVQPLNRLLGSSKSVLSGLWSKIASFFRSLPPTAVNSVKRLDQSIRDSAHKLHHAIKSPARAIYNWNHGINPVNIDSLARKESLSAVKIQSHIRGLLAKSKLRDARVNQILSQNDFAAIQKPLTNHDRDALKKIAREQRELDKSKKANFRLGLAAAKIQAIARKSMSRSQYDDTSGKVAPGRIAAWKAIAKQQRDLDANRNARNESATKIQASIRGLFSRNKSKPSAVSGPSV